jgi:hypothetical protein
LKLGKTLVQEVTKVRPIRAAVAAPLARLAKFAESPYLKILEVTCTTRAL